MGAQRCTVICLELHSSLEPSPNCSHHLSSFQGGSQPGGVMASPVWARVQETAGPGQENVPALAFSPFRAR